MWKRRFPYKQYDKWSHEPAEKRRWTQALEKWGPKRVEVGLSDRAPRFVPGVRRGRLPEKEFRLEDHQQRYLREHTSGITRNLVHGRSASDPPNFKWGTRATGPLARQTSSQGINSVLALRKELSDEEELLGCH